MNSRTALSCILSAFSRVLNTRHNRLTIFEQWMISISFAFSFSCALSYILQQLTERVFNLFIKWQIQINQSFIPRYLQHYSNNYVAIFYLIFFKIKNRLNNIVCLMVFIFIDSFLSTINLLMLSRVKSLPHWIHKLVKPWPRYRKPIRLMLILLLRPQRKHSNVTHHGAQWTHRHVDDSLIS